MSKARTTGERIVAWIGSQEPASAAQHRHIIDGCWTSETATAAARRIDAAIARAVKARDADTKRQTVGWVNYMPHDPDEPFDLVHESRRACKVNVSSNGFLCRVVMVTTPKAAPGKRGNRKGVK